MGSIWKSRKLIKNKRSEEEEEEDGISSLPSSLIGHILSFLPTKDAVKTSVLSTKWKYHWISITNFYLDDRPPFGMKRDNCDQSVKSFINFVYRVLLQSVSDMHKFRLRCENLCDNSHLSQWFSIATLRHVREVDISLLMNDHVMLPHELWTCNTLVVLKLDDMLTLNVPSMVCLPSLKILRLDKIVFSDGDSTERLISSCPVLEDLAILDCYWEDHNTNVFNISALALKSLTIDSNIWQYKILFNTPNLQYLKYFDHVAPEGYSMDNFNSLVKADIRLMSSIGYGIGGIIIGDKSVEEVNVAKFLGGISKVQRLYFHCGSMEALQVCSLPNFYHLTYLELGVLDDGYSDGWELLAELLHALLERAPKLETLVCEELQCYGDDNQFCWHTQRNVPYCLLFHLKIIEIRFILGTSGELKLAGYFLKNAKVLERMVIGSTRNKRSKICNTLLGLPRGSKTCRLEVY